MWDDDYQSLSRIKTPPKNLKYLNIFGEPIFGIDATTIEFHRIHNRYNPICLYCVPLLTFFSMFKDSLKVLVLQDFSILPPLTLNKSIGLPPYLNKLEELKILRAGLISGGQYIPITSKPHL
jgi:hypothetical protein